MEQLKKIKGLKGIVGATFAIILTAYLIQIIDWELFTELIHNFSLFNITLITFFYSSTYIFRAFRLKIILGEKYLLKDLLCITFLHGFWSRLLPLKLGEFALPYYLNRYYPNTNSLGLFTLLLVRLSDLLILLFMFIVSLNFMKFESIKGISEYGLLILAILLLLCILFFRKIIVWIISGIIHFMPKKVLLIDLREKVCKEFYILNFRNFVSLIISSFLLWISMYMMFFFILDSLGYLYSLDKVIFASTFSNLFSVLPSGIGSFGTLEVGWAIGYVLIGISYEVALTHGFIVNLIAFIITSILGITGVILYNYKMRRGKRLNKNSV